MNVSTFLDLVTNIYICLPVREKMYFRGDKNGPTKGKYVKQRYDMNIIVCTNKRTIFVAPFR